MDDQLQLLVSLYKANPSVFTQAEVDRLQEYANANGIRMQRDVVTDEDYIKEAVTGAVGGFVRELTGFWQPFEEPKTEAGQIAKSIGGVFGFVGQLFPGVEGASVGSLGAKALSATGRALQGAESFARVVRVGQEIEALAPAVKNFRSVPLAVSDAIFSQVGKLRAAKVASSMLTEYPMAEQLLKSGARLGVASAASQIVEGFKPALEAGFYGAVAGGVFTGVGNIPFLKEETTVNKVLKAMAGGVAQSTPALIQGASTPRLVEEALLGGYFGYHAQSAADFKAAEFLTAQKTPEDMLSYKSTQEYRDMPDDQKAAADRMYKKSQQPQQAFTVLRDVFKSLGSEKLADDYVSTQINAGDKVTDPETGISGTVFEKNDEAKVVKITDEAGKEQSIPYDRVSLYQAAASAPTPKVDSDASTVNELVGRSIDFEADVKPVASRVRDFVTKMVDEKVVSDEEFYAYGRKLNDKLDEVVLGQRAGTIKDAWQEFKDYAQGIANAASRGKTTLTEEDFAKVKQVYLERTQAIPYRQGYISLSGKLNTYNPISATGKVLDLDNNQLSALRSPNILNKIHDDNELITFVDHAEGFGGLTQKVSLKNVEFVDTMPEKPKKNQRYLTWTQVALAAKEDGRYPFANLGDKDVFAFIKWHPDANTPEKAAQVLSQLRRSVGPEFDAIYEKMRSFSVGEKRVATPEDYDMMVASNAKYAEDMFGMPFEEVFRPRPYVDPEGDGVSQRSVRRGARMTLDEAIDNMKTYFSVTEKFTDPGYRATFTPEQRAEAIRVASGQIYEASEGFISKTLNTPWRTRPRKETLAILEEWKKSGLPSKTPNFISDALDFNKRQQIFFSDFYSLNHELLGRTKPFRVMFHYDWNDVGKKAFGRSLKKESSDGGTIVSSKVYNAIARAIGLPEDSGLLKAFIVSRSPAYGTLLTKDGWHKASPAEDALMEKMGIDFMIPKTGAKQSGYREFYNLDIENGKLIAKTKEGAVVENPNIYEVPVEDAKLSFGVYDNYRSALLYEKTLAKQEVTTMNHEQSSPEALRAMTNYLKDRVAGDVEANKAIDEFLVSPSNEALNKIFHYDDTGKLLPDSQIFDAGLETMIRGMRQNKEFRERMMIYISRNSVEGLEGDTLEFFNGEADIDAAEKRLTGALEMLQWSDGKDAIFLAKPTKAMTQAMITNFFIKSITRPRVKDATKGVLRPYSLDQQSKYDVTDDVFFLDAGHKDTIIRGYTINGERKKMTLGEQWDVLQSLGKAKAERKPEELVYKNSAGDEYSQADIDQLKKDIAAEENPETKKVLEDSLADFKLTEPTVFESNVAPIKAKIESLFNAVLARVPIDSISGSQALRFAGFTDRPGGGILISDTNMQRLGGADTDGDSAFAYFGLPEAVKNDLRRLKAESDTFDERFPKADLVYVNKIDLPLYGKKASPLENALGMMDPYHRLKIGSEVAKGRGKLMGIAVANKFTLNTLMSAVAESAKQSGLGQHTFVLDNGTKITMVPREDNGELLRVMARAGIRTAADIGKYGSMVSSAEMRAILLHAAFKNIYVQKPGERAVDLYVGTKIDPMTGERQLGIPLLSFAGGERSGLPSVFDIPEFRALQEANARMYGYNYQEARGWTSGEVVQAARNLREVAAKFPLLKDHPMLYVAEQVSSMEYRDSNLDRFLPKLDELYKTGRAFLVSLSQKDPTTGESVFKTLFPYFNEEKRVPWKQLVERMKVWKLFSDPLTGRGLSSEEGMTNLAKDPAEFAKFVSLTSKAFGKTEDKFLARKYGNKTLGSWLGPNDRPNTRNRLEYLRRQREALDDFIFTRMWDISSMKAMKFLYDRSGLTPDEAMEIVKLATGIKDQYAKYWKQRLESGRTNDSPGSYDGIVNITNKVRERIIEVFLPQEATRGLDVHDVLDFFEGTLMSSLTQPLKNSELYREGRTSYQRLALDIVQPKVIRLFNKSYVETFDLFETGARNVDLRAFIENQNEVLQQQDVVEVKPKIHARVYFSQKVAAEKLTPENESLVSDIESLLSKYQNITSDDLMQILRSLYGKAQPHDFTINELRGFRDYLRTIDRGPGWLKTVAGKPSGGKDLKVSLRHWTQFPLTTADEMMGRYFNLYTKRIFDDKGNISEDVLRGNMRPLVNVDFETGVLEKVYADVSTPMTHLHRVIQVFNQKSAHVEQMVKQVLHDHDKILGWTVSGIRREGSKEDEADKLTNFAVAALEANGAQERHRELLEAGASKEKIDRARTQWNQQIARLKELTPYFQEIANQTFNISTAGRRASMTGRQVINEIKASIQEFTRAAHSKLIGISDEFLKENVVSRPGMTAVLDVSKSYKQALRYFDQLFIKPEDRIMTHDATRMMGYYDELHTKTLDQLKNLKWRPTVSEVAALRVTDDIKSQAEFFKELTSFDTIPQKKAFLASYLNFLESPEAIATVLQNESTPLAKMAAAKAQADLAGDFAGVQKARAKHLVAYFGYNLKENDIRRRMHGLERYSQYEMDLAYASKKITPYEYMFRTLENENLFLTTGYINGYWPHMNFDKKVVMKWYESRMAEILKENNIPSIEDVKTHPMGKEIQAQLDEVAGSVRRILGENNSPDAILASAQAETVIKEEPGLRHLQEMGGGRTTGNLLRREFNVPGYSTDISILNGYAERIIRATYNNFAAFQSKRIIRDFEAKKYAGEFTKDWSWWLRFYVRDAMNYPSVFPEEALSSSTLNLKRTPYYYMSDHAAFIQGTKANAVAKHLFGKDFMAEISRPEFADYLRRFSSLEAKYEVAALLFHTKTAVANVVGGSTNNWVWTGGRNMYNARKFKTWQKINPEWHGMEDVFKWVESLGVIEDYIVHEGSIVSKRNEPQWARFVDAVVDRLRKEPDMEDRTLFQIAKDKGIPDAIVRTAGMPMRKTERYLRRYAFMSSYLQQRANWDGLGLDYDNERLIENAKKGVEATQFLYDAANRPPFSRTSLGKVYSRFKLWAWSSARFRREVYDMAKFHGFEQGTVEMERFQRLVFADLFMLGLGSLLPYSIFGNNVPPPISYFKDLADWLFGDDKRKKQEFFAYSYGIPGAVSPLAQLAAPILRIGKGLYDVPGTYNVIHSGEFARIGDFTTYSLFPFGRMTKDLLRAYDTPEMATDWLVGIPLHGIAKLKKQGEKK